jgi:hypothetical protein
MNKPDWLIEDTPERRERWLKFQQTAHYNFGGNRIRVWDLDENGMPITGMSALFTKFVEILPYLNLEGNAEFANLLEEEVNKLSKEVQE